jgi:hypothetical protein
MTDTPRHLRKPDVEALLAAADGPTSSALEEATVVREALRPALGRVLGRDAGTPWVELVEAAAATGDWPAARTALVAGAARPDLATDAEAVVEALWDLVTELNERRTIAPD